MNHVVKKSQGFTLIELMLAMGFVSALLLAIAMTIIQIGAIYNQGTTLREINQASRDISEDLRRSISSAGTINIAEDYVLTPNDTNAVGGRLCLGNYTYIWNYAKAIDANPNDTNLTKYGTPPTGEMPILIKVPDSEGIYCDKDAGGLVYKNIRGADVPLAQELLKLGDHELGVHKLGFISPIPASATNDSIGQALYSIEFVIGTNKIEALNTDQSACLTADQPNADPLYCNVQKFTLVVRAGK